MLQRPIRGILAASLLCGLLAVTYLASVRSDGDAGANGTTGSVRDFPGSALPPITENSRPSAPPAPSPSPRVPGASSHDLAPLPDAGPYCETSRTAGPNWSSVIVHCSNESVTREGVSTSSISVSASSFSITTTTTGGAR